jgi:hypothetical protein
MEFALEGPFFGMGAEAGTDGVLADIFPAFVVVVDVAKLAVPVASLPERVFGGDGPVSSGVGFPFFHPMIERGLWQIAGGAEEVDVVGEEDIASNEPVFVGLPG